MAVNYNLMYDFEDYDFEYSLEECEIKDFIEDKMLEESDIDDTYSNRKAIRFMIDRLDLVNDNDFLDSYKEDMEDYFEEVAYESYKQMRQRDADPLGWVGMSQRDFI